jgi:hypothetical protein
MSERKSRAGFARGEKGLNLTRTSVRNRVIMLDGGRRRVGVWFESVCCKSAKAHRDYEAEEPYRLGSDHNAMQRSNSPPQSSQSRESPWSVHTPEQTNADSPKKERRVIARCFHPGRTQPTMPPLPPTTQTLTTRLTALSESNKAVQQLIQRLAKLDFQPGSQPLNADEGDVRLELSAEIHESLKGLEEDLELLRQEVEDFVGAGTSGRRRDSVRDGERSRLAVLLARLTEDLRS